MTQSIFCAARARLSHAHAYAHAHVYQYVHVRVREDGSADREGAMLEDSLYLDNLQEFVQDESRIVRTPIFQSVKCEHILTFPSPHGCKVTYKWLSRKLDVPTDAAKR